MRPRVVPAALALALALGVASPGAAQAPDPVVVELNGFTSPSTSLYEDCDGAEHTLLQDGALLVQRDGPLTDAVTVGLTFAGSRAGSLVDPPDSIVIPAGDSVATATLVFGAPVGAGTLSVTVEPGAGYDLGATTTQSSTVPEPAVTTDCSYDVPVDDGAADQTIEVGEQPDPLAIYGFPVFYEGPQPRDLVLPNAINWDTPVVGALPPGLTFTEDTWAGAATAPGTYRFAVRLCALPVLFNAQADVPLCIGEVDVAITVGAAAGSTPPPGSSPPATPVSAAARFTG